MKQMIRRTARRMPVFALLVTLCLMQFAHCYADGDGSIPTDASPATPAISAKAAVLLEAQSGQVLFSHNADEQMAIASTTKIMTALLIAQACALEQTVAVPAQAVGIEGSSAYLYEGEKLTVEQLLYALMLQSANDAAVTLALHLDQSIEAFAERMNAKAEDLGMQNTHFVNPHGLPDDNHYSTAADMALLTRAALQNETVRTVVGTYRKEVTDESGKAKHMFVNHNRLLRSYEGAIGVKTGYTKAGGRCLVSAAQREGVTLICVTLSDPNDWKDHAALLDWGFSRCSYCTLLAKGALSTVVPVVGTASSTQIKVTNSCEISYISTDGGNEQITDKMYLPRFLYAPKKKGDTVGKIEYYRGGTLIGESPLVLTQSVRAYLPKRGLAAWWERLFG